MADTVKTQVMKALETVFAGIAELNSVHRCNPIGADLDKIKLPALYFYEEGEDGRKANRLRLGIIRLEIAVFIRLSNAKDWETKQKDFEDLADTIAGKIYMLLRGNPGLSGLVIQTEEDPRHKGIGNETFGELVLGYRITYGHAAGDAFSIQY